MATQDRGSEKEVEIGVMVILRYSNIFRRFSGFSDVRKYVGYLDLTIKDYCWRFL